MSIKKIDKNLEDFWGKVEAEFNRLRNDIRHLALPSKADIDSFYASRIIPEVNNVLHSKISAGYLMYPHTESSDYMGMLVSAMESVGCPVPEKYQQKVPKFMLPFIGSKESAAAIVDKAIQEKDLSVDFIESWGEYNRAAAVILALFVNDSSAQDYFSTYIEQGTPLKTVEQHIYAYWMHPRWVLRNEDKIDCQNSLATAIQKELSKSNPQKRLGNLFPILESMIKEDEKGKASLIGRIVNMKKTDIESIVKSQVIPKVDLPDLGW